MWRDAPNLTMSEVLEDAISYYLKEHYGGDAEIQTIISRENPVKLSKKQVHEAWLRDFKPDVSKLTLG